MDDLEKRDYLKYGLHAAILIGVAIAAVKYLNGEEVLEAIASFNYIYAPIMLALSTIYLLLKSWRFVILMEPFTDLRWLITFKAYAAGQAATLLPGGVAARAGLMKQVGVPVGKSSVPVLFSSVIDQAVFILGGLVAALWFPAARMPVLIILAVLAVAAALLLISATREKLEQAADWLAAKLSIEEEWHTFLDSVPKVLTKRILLLSVGITIFAFGLKVAVLALATLGVGLSLPLPTIFLAFILPTMLGRIFPVPAGIGVTEASTVAFLGATSQVDLNTATAAVALFRIATVFFQALLGALVYFFAWKGEEEDVEQEEEVASPTPF